MSSHHRSGGPPSLMDDVRDFDHNFHSHRFEGARGGNRGRGTGGLRGRGGGGGEGGFGSRGGSRGGRSDFHQRDRPYNNHNFHHPDDDVRSSSSKMPSLFNVNHQPPPRSFDRDNHNSNDRGRMPYQRDGGRELSSGDDRYRHPGSRPSANDGPSHVLDFPSDKPGSQSNIAGNSVPSLFAVQLDNPGIPPLISESNKSTDSYKDQHHAERSHGRSEHSSSHHDNDNRHRERDSRKNDAGSYDRSSSSNRDRSRSPRDRDRHGPPRDDRSFGMENRRGARGGRVGGDQLSRGHRGAHQHNPRESHQSRFGSDHHQSNWQDRRGGGRGQYHDRSRDMGSHHRPNEQLPSEHHRHSFPRENRPNFDGPTQNRPFQEGGYPVGNFDPMGPSGQNRSNYNQGPPSNRPEYYGSNNNNNPGFSQHGSRSGGRPSRFSDRQDEYDDERPLTKPNLPLPNVPTTTPLYMNQPNNPTFSQPRPPLSTTFSSQQQPPSGLFPTMGPNNDSQPPPSQYPWLNQQLPGSTNSHMTQPLTSMGSKDQSNPSLLGAGPMPNFYGGNNEFHRQQTAMTTNPYYAGVPPVSAQTASKPSTVNPPSMGLPQTSLPTSTASNPTAASNPSNIEAWRQYYQQYWQLMQQQQASTQLSGINPLAAQQMFPQSQSTAAAAATSSKATTTASATVQDPNATQANMEAWAQSWIQYQAYAQQQAQMPTIAATVPGTTTTITAPSQLYSQTSGKQTTSASTLPSTGISLMSNPQSWLNPKG